MVPIPQRRDGQSQGLGWLADIADPVKFAVVRALAEGGLATVAELAESCQASVPTVRRHLSALVASGIAVEELGASDGTTVGRPATRYRLHQPIAESARELIR